MAFSQHLKTFAGLPVRWFNPKAKSKPDKPCVWRVGGFDYVKSDYGDGQYEFPELVDLCLAAHGGKDLTALVLGVWYEADSPMLDEGGAGDLVEALVSNRQRMPNLRALFIGDITSDDCEVSWIGYGDMSAILPAFPKLEEFSIRGSGNLRLGKIRHPKLRKLVIEGGGLPEPLLRELWKADLPKLEHLELYLGSPNYDGISDAEPLKPLLKGKLFPKLKYLGLRDSFIADDVARAVADSPILERLHTLDLSLGNLTEVGAEALLQSPGVRKLKKLDLHHHFISPVFVRELKKLPIEVDVNDVRVPDFFSSGETTDVYRYIAVDE
jgi:hypothetical protein